MAKRRREIEAIDPGTAQMARHFSVVPKMIDNNTRAMRVLDGTEVDALLLRDEINPNQHATLNLLARKLQSYGYSPLRSPDYSGRIHSDATLIAERKAEAMRGAVHLIERLDRHPHVGKYRRKKLVNLVMEDAPWGKLRHQIEELWAVVDALDSIFTTRPTR